jgi:FkbM family methyltransferase
MSSVSGSFAKASRRALIRLLDRPGGRTLLGTLATAYARRHQPGAKIFYDPGSWVRQLGDDYCIDGPTFPYYTQQLRSFGVPFREVHNFADEIWFAGYKPKPGDVVVDVGAAWGRTTQVLARRVGDDGRVLAIEAHPGTFALLEKAVALNRMTNTRCVNAAVLAEPGTVTIDDRNDHAANRIETADAEGGGILVQGDSLDNICRRHDIDAVDFMLMNIEGAERLAIRGMADLTPRLRSLCIFCHDFLADETGSEWYRTKQLVIEFLEQAGYEVITRDSDPRPYLRDCVVATRR